MNKPEIVKIYESTRLTLLYIARVQISNCKQLGKLFLQG